MAIGDGPGSDVRPGAVVPPSEHRAPNGDHVFANWTEAAAHAKQLLAAGKIDHGEFQAIMVRAHKEQASAARHAPPPPQVAHVARS